MTETIDFESNYDRYVADQLIQQKVFPCPIPNATYDQLLIITDRLPMGWSTVARYDTYEGMAEVMMTPTERGKPYDRPYGLEIESNNPEHMFMRLYKVEASP